MKKLTLLTVFGILSFVNIADARWFASMEANPVYNYDAELEIGVSLSGGSISLGGGSAGATLVGINYECGFALSTCDESKQKFVKVG
jgi:hypothetical protein